MKKPPYYLLLLLALLFFSPSSSAVDFLFNGFDPSNITLFGNASLQSRILSLTSDTTFSNGRALFPIKIPTKSSSSSTSTLPFSTSFIFAVSQLKSVLPGHGLAFLFAPFAGINGTSTSQNLGLFNGTNNGDPTNHVFAVEFDVFQNPEFKDIDANHVGLDLNSLTSVDSHTAGFWLSDGDGNGGFVNYPLNDGHNYQVWIDYRDSVVNVTMARVGSPRPARPLISRAVNLSAVLLDEMYVGFCAATGQLVQSHRVLAWSFSNSNFSAHEALITSNLPSFVPQLDSGVRSKAFIAGVSAGAVVVAGTTAAGAALFWARRRRRKKEEEETEDWELEYWPHRIPYKEIVDATNRFSEANVIGVGGNGKVYKGVLAGGADIAVKCISHDRNEGSKEFLAEVSSLGRLKHRNLVGLRGWCKRDRASLMVVYDFMENGSLDKWIFDCGEDSLLLWDARIRVLKDVGNGILYLHEGWEAKVLHRDIKASNVMLDKQMNGKLGDFGLARMHGHGKALTTTSIIGTVGYMAPEFVKSGKATVKTDVYGFGVLILEVLCGRRPVENDEPGLVEWAWGMMEQGRLVEVVDRRLLCKNRAVDEEEAERVLKLGLLCTYPDPHSRPTMRQAMKMLDGGSVEGDEGDGEAIDAYLMSKLEPKNWSKYRRWSVRRSHPTFEEIQQSMSTTSTSLSASDMIEEGR